MVFSLLTLFAFIAHGILERGDRLYQRCLATTSRRKFWNTLRTAMRMILVTVWAESLWIYLDEAGPSPESAAVQAGTCRSGLWSTPARSRWRLEASSRSG
jgi:hypothetical protein